jgi:hypothetical protein
MDEAACADAIAPTGLAGLWAAVQIEYVSARSAMRFDSSRPPDFGMSMCTPGAGLEFDEPSEAWVYRFSPVQIGTPIACATLAMASALSGGTGSSSYIGFKCASALPS